MAGSALKTLTPTRNARRPLPTFCAHGFRFWSGTAKSPIKAAVRPVSKTHSTASKAAGLVLSLCSRKRLAGGGSLWRRRFVYNGCLPQSSTKTRYANKTPAWRIQVPDQRDRFSEWQCRTYAQNLARYRRFRPASCRRLWAYQLAVVTDDADQA